ncbi:MAG: hypothetical protein Fur0018_06470 [Anaerolineales bacterium]
MTNPTQNNDSNSKTQYLFNMTLVAVSSQVGCFTLVIIVAALLGGLWLDNVLQTRPMFTILLLVFSVPVTVVAMLWIVRRATAKIQSVPKDKS